MKANVMIPSHNKHLSAPWNVEKLPESLHVGIKLLVIAPLAFIKNITYNKKQHFLCYHIYAIPTSEVFDLGNWHLKDISGTPYMTPPGGSFKIDNTRQMTNQVHGINAWSSSLIIQCFPRQTGWMDLQFTQEIFCTIFLPSPA